MKENLDIVSHSKLQSITEVEGALEEGVVVLGIVVDGKVLRDEGDLGVRDLTSVVVLEGELELGEAVEELAGQLVEEYVAVTVELGGDSDGRSGK